MRFPPSFIERLRNHFLMSEVVGKRIALKKHGREYHGLCPFHNEKTPSFNVNDEKGFYHCFGCSAHGDAIEFIRKYERLTYPETIERLALDAGIPLPEVSREDTKKYEREKTLLDVMEAATQWFEKQLMTTSGTVARDYIEKRGLKPETLRLFRIGYAPEEKSALTKYLTAAGFPQALQAEAGLIIVPEQGPAFDRFRSRVMFPIRNASGKVIAFGGRLLANSSTNQSLPKYLNSPETPLFKKGEMLFNLDLAKRPARENNIAVVMEGYMDVVSTAQSGINYAVATLGTAVTPEHLRLLWQLAKEPVICLDGDAAGNRAMLRAAEMALPLLKPGYSLRFAMLPQGEDPDTYVQKHGKASFEKILNGSRRLSQTLWDILAAQHKLNLPEGRAALEHASKQLAEKIADPTVKTHYLSYFKKQLWEKAAPAPMLKDKDGKRLPAEKTRSHLVEQMVVSHHSAALETLSQRLLKTLLKFPSLLHKSQVEETLSRLDIRNPRLDALRNTLLSALGHVDLDNHEVFIAYMHEQLPDEWLSGLINNSAGDFANRAANDGEAAQLWDKTVAAYERAHLDIERKELEESLGQSVNEEAVYYQKIDRLNQIKHLQSTHSFASVESDIA